MVVVVHWWHVVVVIVVMVIVMVVIVVMVIRMVVHDVAVEVSEANWAAFMTVLVVKDSAAEANVIANGAIIVIIVVMIVVHVLVVLVNHLPHHVAEFHFFFAGHAVV